MIYLILGLVGIYTIVKYPGSHKNYLFRLYNWSPPKVSFLAGVGNQWLQKLTRLIDHQVYQQFPTQWYLYASSCIFSFDTSQLRSQQRKHPQKPQPMTTGSSHAKPWHFSTRFQPRLIDADQVDLLSLVMNT